MVGGLETIKTRILKGFNSTEADEMAKIRAYKFIGKTDNTACTHVTHIKTTQAQFKASRLNGGFWVECSMCEINEDKKLHIQAGIEYFGGL